MQQTIQVPVSASLKLWAVVHTPDDLATNTEQCALLMFCHGVGEAGSTQASASKLIPGSPLSFATGAKFEFASPADGKKHRFIVVGIQAPSWSPSPAQVKYAIENEFFQAKYKVNKNAVFITGLSAGGQTTLDSVTTTGILELYAACIPMSPANDGDLANIQATATNKIESWGFSGASDGGYTGNLYNFSNALDLKADNTARITIYPGGHGGWDKFYNPLYKEDFAGVQLNIYEYLLANIKGSTWINPSKDLSVTAEFDFTYTNGTITLDASKSTNATPAWNGYGWNVTPLPGGNWNTDTVGGGYGNPKIINKAKGDYSVTLTVTDVFGKTAQVSKVVREGTLPVPPVKQVVFNIEFGSEKAIGYSDKTWQ